MESGPYSAQMRAIKTYQSNHQQGSTGREAMAEAMRVVIQKLLLARDAFAANALDQMCDHNAKNIKILDVLREELKGSGALDDTDAGMAAKFLNTLYADAIIRISGILSHADPRAEFDALIELFKPIYKAWLGVPEEAGAAADTPASNA